MSEPYWIFNLATVFKMSLMFLPNFILESLWIQAIYTQSSPVRNRVWRTWATIWFYCFTAFSSFVATRRRLRFIRLLRVMPLVEGETQQYEMEIKIYSYLLRNGKPINVKIYIICRWSAGSMLKYSQTLLRFSLGLYHPNIIVDRQYVMENPAAIKFIIQIVLTCIFLLYQKGNSICRNLW